MRRTKPDPPATRNFKLSHFLFVLGGLYLIFISLKLPQFFQIGTGLSEEDSLVEINKESEVGEGDLDKPYFGSVYKDTYHRKLEVNHQDVLSIPDKGPLLEEKVEEAKPIKPLQSHYGRITGEIMRRRNRTSEFSLLDRMADEAWNLGLKAWRELDNSTIEGNGPSSVPEKNPETCPSGLSMTGEELRNAKHIMFLPCGLAAGSSITVVGTPHHAHKEFVPQLARLRQADPMVAVSQFVVELQGLKSVEGEAPPKILHLNPRLKGDWSRKPVIEHNTCYRTQWGTSQRCNGLPADYEDDMLVDGYRRCERWMRSDTDSKESKTASWFKRFVGREQKPELAWPFPFIEGRLFILTVRAGVDGFLMSVGGLHQTSFPYRPGFTLEDATGLAVTGNVDVHAVYATSLPASHPSFAPNTVLEFSPRWKGQPLAHTSIKLFIGVLSSTNHFAERMAVRKTWMQSSAIQSGDVVARFFVALNPRNEVNAVLKKEAAYFGDVIILPFMDRYELVVLKTISICEYGVQNVTAAYIMKCDDDTFVRVERVLSEIDAISPKRSLYMGNLNLLHRPLRNGKWAVAYEEWPEAVYPPYANGPGYIISSDIAKFIVSERAKRSLRLFKMEDVSMGMWVEQFNSTTTVQYSHSWNFCQYGCLEGYFTAHYQSPRQMICLWDKLSRGRARCCNFR